MQTHWQGVKVFRESWFKHRGNTFLGLTLSVGNAMEMVLEKNLDIKGNLLFLLKYIAFIFSLQQRKTANSPIYEVFFI